MFIFTVAACGLVGMVPNGAPSGTFNASQIDSGVLPLATPSNYVDRPAWTSRYDDFNGGGEFIWFLITIPPGPPCKFFGITANLTINNSSSLTSPSLEQRVTFDRNDPVAASLDPYNGEVATIMDLDYFDSVLHGVGCLATITKNYDIDFRSPNHVDVTLDPGDYLVSVIWVGSAVTFWSDIDVDPNAVQSGYEWSTNEPLGSASPLRGQTFLCGVMESGVPAVDVWVTPVCVADLDNDGILDLADINSFVIAFSQVSATVDFNNDGVLDLIDIGIFIESFLSQCSTL